MSGALGTPAAVAAGDAPGGDGGVTVEVLVVGSANADLVVGVERRPGAGETVLGTDLAIHPGGKGAALGAVRALGDRAGDEVAVVGFDGTPDGLAAGEAGTLHASVAQQPEELGRVALRNA
ncbi:substrate-binding domain-containing protein, partial [Streptomyces bohaiensis]